MGGTHHIFLRGVARANIAADTADYERALFLLERAVTRFELECHAWCYLPNHSHLLVTAPLGNLSRAMQWLDARMAETFNKRHGRSGHLFQGRFGSRLVDSETYLLELARYVPLNPVKAKLCGSPEDWPWSSYAATVGLRAAPWFLQPSAFLELLASVDAYVAWVGEGVDSCTLDEHGFLPAPPGPSLAELLPIASDALIALAHYEHGCSQAAIARHLGVNRSQICRRLARHARTQHAGSDPERCARTL